MLLSVVREMHVARDESVEAEAQPAGVTRARRVNRLQQLTGGDLQPVT